MAGAHHRGSYAARARKLRAAANADPLTRCWRCGRTLAEHGRAWTAGHIAAGAIDGVLLPECAGCNYSEGAKHGARTRSQGVTREW